MRKLRYLSEALLVWLLLRLLKLLPLDLASGLGGWVAEHLGTLTKAHRTALANLAHVFPEKTHAEHQRIARGAWNNLGRVAGEFPFIADPIMTTRITLHGEEHLHTALTRGKNILFFSGHIGNWELCARAAHDQKVPLALIYRPANNPWVDAMMLATRRQLYDGFFTKGRKGARALLAALKQGQHLALLVDQKMNEGVAIPFFGRPAMTAPAIAELAQKYDATLLGCRVERRGGAHFHIHLHPVSFAPEDSTESILLKIHHLLEAWIIDTPEQWFWMHNRWPKDRG